MYKVLSDDEKFALEKKIIIDSKQEYFPAPKKYSSGICYSQMLCWIKSSYEFD